MMNYAEGMQQLRGHREQIATLRSKMRKLQTSIVPEPVDDYAFATCDRPVRLSSLFGDKDDLFIIHSMGASCPYCTLWADGYNGIYHHLVNRAAFVVSSPDAPEVQKRLAENRGWRFPMVSHRGTSFAADMGYQSGQRLLPGLSVFQRRDGCLVRVSDSGSNPGDDFCALWHLFDLLPEGAEDWRPERVKVA
ncbi:MAG: DUF899 family protein [Geminicoccaceae bacterium]